MAKQTKPAIKPQDIASLTLVYDLPSLPTAQHKAGLAGMVLMIKAMEELDLGPRPQLDGLSPTGVRITLTQESLQAIVNVLYDAEVIEISVKSKQTSRELKREEEVTEIDRASGKPKKSRRFIYEQVQPKGGFFGTRTFGGCAEKAGWMKLWRDAIWGTVRGIPTTRNPYNERAKKRPATGSGVGDLWGQLTKEEVARLGGGFHPISIDSSIWLGAQDHNAETVPFKGSPSETLLLHFWVAVMQCFVPQELDRDGKITTGKGFIIAIPETSDLVEFLADFPAALHSLSADQNGFWPADALVCMPEEGALAFQSMLLARIKSQVELSLLEYSISGVEVFYLHKPRRVVMTRSSARVPLNWQALKDFERVNRRMHPILRAHLIRNLVHERPWYSGFGRLAAVTDADWLVGTGGDGNTWSTAQFCSDVRSWLKQQLGNIEMEAHHG
ncbi:MAG TPA: type I-MYXAN CRISPR-associated protein Cmx8 [Phycisphaerae bacterium]|nr:type I-MYXAN CRISPR-associated protein Cmx8 [Phycisphaerae bacterium]